MATTHQWQFAPRFRRNAFGWKSDTPILRIKEALAEIKAVAKKEPVLAAEGAILFLEKLAAAVEQVDSSSGRIGSAVNRAIEILVTVIVNAQVPDTVRAKWLDRLWAAYEADHIPVIEYLAEFWGELCVTPALAGLWADRLVAEATVLWDERVRSGKFAYYRGATACFGALYAAGRHDQLLALIATPAYKFTSWHERIWSAKALVAAGKHAEAIRYAEATDGFNTPRAAIAAFCERVLLDTGFTAEAYARYALDATWATTNLATFKAVVKKYPEIPRETILRGLVARHPGEEGKWFAAAKDAGLFALAIDLANRSPSDPRTLTRAARDYADKQPEFARAAGMTALYGIARGWGYEITGADVLDAYAAVVVAAGAEGVDEAVVKADVRVLIAATGEGGEFLGRVLAGQLLREQTDRAP